MAEPRIGVKGVTQKNPARKKGDIAIYMNIVVVRGVDYDDSRQKRNGLG